MKKKNFFLRMTLLNTGDANQIQIITWDSRALTFCKNTPHNFFLFE